MLATADGPRGTRCGHNRTTRHACRQLGPRARPPTGSPRRGRRAATGRRCSSACPSCGCQKSSRLPRRRARMSDTVFVDRPSEACPARRGLRCRCTNAAACQPAPATECWRMPVATSGTRPATPTGCSGEGGGIVAATMDHRGHTAYSLADRLAWPELLPRHSENGRHRSCSADLGTDTHPAIVAGRYLDPDRLHVTLLQVRRLAQWAAGRIGGPPIRPAVSRVGAAALAADGRLRQQLRQAVAD